MQHLTSGKIWSRSGVLTLAAGCLILAAGIWAGYWRSYETDHRLKDELLTQAIEISGTINPSVVKRLTFSPSDLENPAYHRLRSQMIAYGRLISQRGIYSMALQDTTIVFGPENYPDGDPMGAGPPGTPYLQPTDEDYAIFKTGVPIVMGPESDEYGTFISALAPVFDPGTGKVLMVLGIDIMADEWKAKIIEAWLLPLTSALIALILLGAGYFVVRRRNKGLMKFPEKWWHFETALVALTGLALTLTMATGIRQKEQREQYLNFKLQSENQVNELQEELLSIQRGIGLLKNFIENSQEVTQEEFSSFTASLHIDPDACTFLWLPGLDNQVWANNPPDDTHTALFSDNYQPFRLLLDTNLSNLPGVKLLMNRSKLSGLSESEYLQSSQHKENRDRLLLVANPAGSGFCMAIVNLNHLQNHGQISHTNQNIPVDLVLMDPENTNTRSITRDDYQHSISPLFVFGRVFAIKASLKNKSLFETANFIMILVIFTGLSLTLLLTLFVRFIRSRQANLEVMVTDRTVELLKAKEKAEESDRLKSAFLANMSHEIRTPMNAIVGFSSALADPELSSEERDHFVEIINNRSDDLLHLINDILDISRIESGNATLLHQTVNLNKLIFGLGEEFTGRIVKAGKTHLVLKVERPLSDQDSDVVSDPYILGQVYSNLLDNALKYTNKGYIKFGYSVPEEGMLSGFVEDSGIGIEPQYHRLIFEHFRQSDRTDQQLYGGTGLGLAICKGSLALLGGTISVESKPGKGSRFEFRIPFVTPGIQPEPQGISPLSTNPQTYEWSGRKILLVEDDPANMEYLKAVLKRTCIGMESLASAAEVRRHFNSIGDFDVVLLDIRLPDAEGWDLVNEIKKLAPNLPVIAQTAYAMSSDRQKSEKSGFDDYITKPLNRNELLQKLSRFLDH